MRAQPTGTAHVPSDSAAVTGRVTGNTCLHRIAPLGPLCLSTPARNLRERKARAGHADGHVPRDKAADRGSLHYKTCLGRKNKAWPQRLSTRAPSPSAEWGTPCRQS